ncbi:flagellar protein FlbB [Bradyrhizobium sp. U87765 SZCCT0131]|uniref:MotE family protein n=1 Tax=unclassified Bradyrhizobium TaxID=2631580 RepID=UPI001BAE4AA4|nr:MULTISPECIES: flagellar protein FlbB [unclassified Bradyrhizobium]MBR1219763.1 flagellar protein FlbB [Bradyrhizobium sp. U87765 SZCCT0131]MBR1262414.1 flagellar protein FlbB [Bradyrhizobium sp. U87765 SZCCT0134]MBR1308403.1 flagellar protein FlbB [Bradyrhizobium sp. U87765 SZCCT0110]MBR1318196.1 flagellar protein FlbB [Bradyrhizobium sp. U87765 SZCCT0109]MBR1351899.1 flagellar protein FlbB [Bradyrhizobium sp. U87765 SZCCT0048]
MKSARNFRVIPLVLAAIIGLVVLKTLGLVLDGGYIFSDREVPAPARTSWAQEMLNFPTGRASRPAIDPVDITGSVSAKKEDKAEAPKEAPKAAAKEGTKEAARPAETPMPQPVVVTPDSRTVSPSERAILERLQERRQELEARAREIDIRENLLKAAEKRIEGKVEEMKAVEARIGAAREQKTEADAARFKGIVTMYEAMKPKDAAKIFDRLDMSVLIEVASQIAPRKLSDIVGLMQPEAAERLTVELARRAGGDKTAAANDLPKIEGRPPPDAN